MVGLSELEPGKSVEGDFALKAGTSEEEGQADLVKVEVWRQVWLVDPRMG